jgi:hypothetical protein
MRSTAAGIFTVTVPLDKGRSQFKIASKEWSNVLFGARFDENDIELDESHPLEQWGGDLILEARTAGNYEFQLDTRDPLASTLLIRRTTK